MLPAPSADIFSLSFEFIPSQWLTQCVYFARVAIEDNCYIEGITINKETQIIRCYYRRNRSSPPIGGNEHYYQLMEALDTMTAVDS